MSRTVRAAVLSGCTVALAIAAFTFGSTAGGVSVTNKYTGPAEPPANWFQHSFVLGATSTAKFAPNSGEALIVRTIQSSTVDAVPNAEASLFVSVGVKNCGTGAGALRATLLRTIDEFSNQLETFEPGIMVPAGDVLCLRLDSQPQSSSTVSVTGYSLPGGFVPHA